MCRLRPILLLFLLLEAFSCSDSRPQPSNAPGELESTPNLVVIFVDDLGFGDLGCTGGDFRTPNIDRLATEGAFFTDFSVAQPVCSASRAALLTGCYPNRLGIHGALGPSNNHGLDPDETTLAEMLKEQGYATAVFGKWHLGLQPEVLPTRQGFDHFAGIPYSNDMWPQHPESDAYPPLPLFEQEEIVEHDPDQRKFTRGFAQRGVEFIQQSVTEEKPFFLYLPQPMPHVPLFVSEEFEGHSGKGLYGDVVEEIDAAVGMILTTLDELKIADNTMVIFASDNGPWLSYGDHAGSTGGLREGKGTVFEGGVREPLLMRWPNGIPAGRVIREPAMAIDILPTIATFAHAKLPERTIDGRDISALLTGASESLDPNHQYYYWYNRNELHAMRSGRWKLHFPHGYRTMNGCELGSGGMPGKYDYSAKTGLELYDLATDPKEQHDVAAEYPRVVRELTSYAKVMRQRLGDRLQDMTGSEIREPRKFSSD
ncbi:MAG: sulfatase [Planctomycetes bacterium]|nr:sulfatase [Planctomycetota bacterium]MCP4771056.1 sulfatase [Planctomycetota bacterium]MCP4861927.1 sulfatase [Planctomycetota bacterium]